ncbi:hypothetical protein [Sorangium sp. So ce1078]
MLGVTEGFDEKRELPSGGRWISAHEHAESALFRALGGPHELG